MSSATSIHTIVLDAGPILQNNPTVSTLLSKSESLVTVPSVTSEIKDARARSLLDNTLRPFLDVKTPSPLSVKFVTDFARKTGDLAVLSKTDVEILALVYELDCQRNGGDKRLRKSPGQKGLNGLSQHPTVDAPEDSIATPLTVESDKTYEPTTIAPWAKIKIPQSNPDLAAPEGNDIGDHVDTGSEPLDTSAAPTGGITKIFDDLNIENAPRGPEFVVDCDRKESPGKYASPQDAENSLSEDSDGWITPSNIRKVQATAERSSTSAIPPEATLEVAIITTDFAMQNVVLQIGLNLLSPNLQRIRNIRTYVLRCHACFQIVKDTSKQFCPRCGKPTLTRVSCSTNAKGEFKIHLKKNMQWNHRGDRYSVPKPVPGQANGKVGRGKGGGKGGWGQELILAEDQKEYQRALGSSGRAKGLDPLDDEYLPGILTGDRGRTGGRPKVGAGRNVNSKKRA